jgi:acetyl esterase/lipase
VKRALALLGCLALLAGCATTRAPRSAEGIRSAGSGAPIDFGGAWPAPRGYCTAAGFGAAYASGRLHLLAPDEPRELPAGVRERRDVVYASPGGRNLHLDLYLPEVPPGSVAPCVLFVHGGSWKSGKKSDVRFYAVRYAARGYATATVEYRLSGEAVFPAALEDLRSAVRFLRDHAPDYGIAADSLALVGHSAGAHLALLAAYAPDAAGKSAGVSAVVDFYGPADLTTPFASSHPVVRAFLGTSYRDSPAVYEAASPLRHVRSGLPPTLIFHGTIDGTVPVAQSESLFLALGAAGVEAYLDRVEGWPHAMDVEARVNRHCAEVMDVFLDRVLKPGRRE